MIGSRWESALVVEQRGVIQPLGLRAHPGRGLVPDGQQSGRKIVAAQSRQSLVHRGRYSGYLSTALMVPTSYGVAARLVEHRVTVVAETFDPASTLEGVLTEHGPVSTADLATRLRDAGVADPETVLRADQFEISYPVGQLVDERWVWLPALLAGRVFTHRLGADELAHDLLLVAPDLQPVTGLCEHDQYRRLADGSSAQGALADYDDELLEERGVPPEMVDTSPALLLEPGTLAALGVAAGDLVGARLTAHGLALERITGTGAGAAAGTRLAETLDSDEPDDFSTAVWTACHNDPGLFTEPLPPLGEIADDCALARRGEWLAPGGFDFNLWDFEGGCARLADRHDLDDDDAFVVYTLVQLHGQTALLLQAAADADESRQEAAATPDEGAAESDEFSDLVGDLGAALVDPVLAEALVDETVGPGGDGAAALGMFAEVLEAKAPPAARVACRWLRAVACERIGDIDAAERELLAAESMDVDWPLPLFDLARFASDRGDAEHGLALLHRADAEDDYPLLELLQRYRSEPRRDLGRNDPCWCGSGRKYKKCHLSGEVLPLSERAGWLYAKACGHALLGDWNGLLVDVALERCRYADPAESTSDVLADALAEPLVLDAVLFEGGAFAEFLAVRGSLLPDDERLLAEQWLQVDRSVFAVEQVHRGQSITARDVRTGDTHEVRGPAGGLKAGQLVCARVVPAGEAMACFSGLEPVEPNARDPLIELLDSEPDAVTLMAQLSS